MADNSAQSNKTLNVQGPMIAVRARANHAAPNQPLITIYAYDGVLPFDTPMFGPERREIELSNETIECVAAYVHWRTRGEIRTPLTPVGEGVRDSIHHIYDHLARLYTFGERVPDAGFKRAVIDKIVNTAKKGDGFPDADSAGDVYEGTVDPASGGRQLFAFLIALSANNDMELQGILADADDSILNDARHARIKIRRAALRGLLAEEFYDP